MTKQGLVLALAFIAGGGVFLILAMRPGHDLNGECKTQCGVRHYRLTADRSCGTERSGAVRVCKCECY
jgi:hypothetical protein